MDYFKVDELGFEIMAEFSTYEDALANVTLIMQDCHSDCCFIWNRMSGETPYKVMVIPYSRL